MNNKFCRLFFLIFHNNNNVGLVVHFSISEVSIDFWNYKMMNLLETLLIWNLYVPFQTEEQSKYVGTFHWCMMEKSHSNVKFMTTKESLESTCWINARIKEIIYMWKWSLLIPIFLMEYCHVVTVYEVKKPFSSMWHLQQISFHRTVLLYVCRICTYIFVTLSFSLPVWPLPYQARGVVPGGCRGCHGTPSFWQIS